MNEDDQDSLSESERRLAFSEISRILGSKQPCSKSLIELLQLVGTTTELDLFLVSRGYGSTDLVVLNSHLGKQSKLRDMSRRLVYKTLLRLLENTEDRRLELQLNDFGFEEYYLDTVIVPVTNFSRECLVIAVSPEFLQPISYERSQFIERVSDAFGLILKSRDDMIEKRISQFVAEGHHEIASTLLRLDATLANAELVTKTKRILSRLTRSSAIHFTLARWPEDQHSSGFTLGPISMAETLAPPVSVVHLPLLQGEFEMVVTLKRTKPISQEVLNSARLIFDLFASGVSYLLETERADRISKDTLRLALALNRVPTGIVIASPVGDVSYWNASAYSMFGYNEMDRVVVRQLIDENESQELLDSVISDVLEGASRTINLRAKRRDGTIFHSTWVGAVLRDSDLGKDFILWTVNDSSEATSALQTLEHQAHRDYLTGMFNMRALMNSLSHIVTTLNKPFLTGVVFIDLDDFKSVNDTYGHYTGDTLLKIVGQRIERCLRKGDIAGRISGDEFLVILPVVASSAQAERISRRITKSLLDEPAFVDGVKIWISASVGVATTDDPTTSPEDLIRQADNSMYAMKRGGRLARSRRRAEIANSSIEPRERVVGEVLGDALSGGDQLRVTYIPIYDLVGNQVFGISTSLELQDPRIGCVPYPAISRAAEVAGLHFPLFEWYLTRMNKELYERFIKTSSSRLSQLALTIKVPRRTLEDRPRIMRVLRERDYVEISTVILDLDHSALEYLKDEDQREFLGSLNGKRYSIAVEVHDDIGSLVSLFDLSPTFLKLSPGVHSWEKMGPLVQSYDALSTSLSSQLVATEVNSLRDFEIVRKRVRLLQGLVTKGTVEVDRLEEALDYLDLSGLGLT